MTTLRWKSWWEKWAQFSPKQQEAERMISTADFVLYGGSAGGGKSYFLRKIPVKFLIEECWHRLGVRGARIGLFCEDYPTLHDRHVQRLPFEFPRWLGAYNGSRHEFVLNEKYGAGVIAFRNLDDPSKYMSSEFAMVLVDELTKNPRETFDFLRMRMRYSGVDKPKFVGATNPGGVGHAWVKKLWIDREFDSEEREADRFAFVPAKATDNPHLAESYYRTLDSLPEKMRRAYRDGSWDVFAGQYFAEWDRSVHVVDPFELPVGWRRFRAYDHGREAPACCLWGALDHDGGMWIYRELYARGLNVDQVAAEISRLSEGESYDWSIADPAIFANTGMVDRTGGQTIAESFVRSGIMFAPASNRRVDGWALVHQYLTHSAIAPPKLKVFKTCINTIREFPAAVHAELKPEDLDTKGSDHALDACRYLLMSLHETATPRPLVGAEAKLAESDRNEFVHPKHFNVLYGG